MHIRKSLIFGGHGGLGQVVTETLRSQDKEVLTISRKESNAGDHIQFDMSTDDAEVLIPRLPEEIDNIVFCQRYRGTDQVIQCIVTIVKPIDLIYSLLDRLATNSSIVFIGSRAHKQTYSEQDAIYHATRGAIQSLVNFFSVTLNEVRVNCVLPGTMTKPTNVHRYQASSSDRLLLENITPLGKMSDAQDVANVVAFLCSKQSSLVTGETITVDGGLSKVSSESIAKRILNKGSE